MKWGDTTTNNDSKQAGELLLSGVAVAKLLRAVHEKKMPFRIQVLGSSMFPFIKNGDVVTISSLKGKLPRLGDVVACIQTKTSRLFIHRVIRKRNDYIITQGDNASIPDKLVAKTDILGYVTKIERNGRKIHLSLGLERIILVILIKTGFFPPILLVLRRISNILKKRRLR